MYDQNLQNQSGSAVQKAVGIFSILAFLGDIFLLVVLVASLLGIDGLRSSQPIFVQFLLVTVVYAFAFSLFIYARPAYSEIFEAIVYLFGWVYILLSALLLAVVAQTFVTQFGFGFLDFLAHAVTVVVISSFGFIIARAVNEKVIYFAFPFLLVAIWQVYLWVWRVLSRSGVSWNWNLAGSLFLFAFTVFFIAFLLRMGGRRKDGDGNDPWW